jgi:hypothetical protein
MSSRTKCLVRLGCQETRVTGVVQCALAGQVHVDQGVAGFAFGNIRRRTEPSWKITANVRLSGQGSDVLDRIWRKGPHTASGHE